MAKTKVPVINQSFGEHHAAYHADCVEGIKMLDADSIGYSIFSPPFSSLYTYSASDRDMGNCKDDAEFFEHFAFLIRDLYRVIQPGRLVSIHCMQMPTLKSRDGYLGIKDFRGDIIRAFQKEGFIFHPEVCIWKDPVTQMQRTKSIGLLHKQIVKDSCVSRQGLADYLVTMRKPGENKNPVSCEFERWVVDYSNKSNGRLTIDVWQSYSSTVCMHINPSDTLQFRSAREHADERHICPLQLQVIERGLELWSNPGDVVLSPFMGIGSEGYVSIEADRKFIGFELKESYFRQAAANLAHAESKKKEMMLL